MKKLLLATLFLLAVPSFAMAAPTVTVTSPNGGETLTVGSVAHITWNSTNSDKVMLGYSSCSSCLDWITSGTISNTGSYDWTVNVGNTTNTQFKIYVTAYQTGVGSAYDYSDNYFTVNKASTASASPAITSISPSQIAVGTTAVTLSGKNFNSTLVIALTGPGADTTVTPTYVSSDGMSMTFNFPATITVPGTYSVQVANYGVPIYGSINVTLVGPATILTPAITSAYKNTTSDLSFTVYGTNLASVVKLQYQDTGPLNYQSGELSGAKIKSVSSNEAVFYPNIYMSNSLNLYKIKVVDTQGNVSNEASLDLRPILAAPTITSAYKNTSDSSFTVNGTNLTNLNKLQYTDTINNQTGELSSSKIKSASSNQVVFYQDISMVNSLSLYKIKVLDTQGNVSNEVSLDLRLTTTTTTPTVTLKANNSTGPITILYNSPVTLSWAFTGSVSGCAITTKVDGDNYGSTPSSGVFTTGNLTKIKYFFVYCDGNLMSNLVQVNVSSPVSANATQTTTGTVSGNTMVAQNTATQSLSDQVGQDTQTQSGCVDLQYNLKYRSRDASTNGEVSDLQDFLVANGYLSGEPTGYFGLMTVAAVKKFQAAALGATSATPGYGNVGPKSRAKIKAMTCSVGA